MAYAREIGALGTGEPADYVLMALVSLEDPGLTVFATHRLLKDLDEGQRLGIRDAAKAGFELREVTEEELVPDPDDPPGSFGYMDAHHLQAWRLTPEGPEAARRRASRATPRPTAASTPPRSSSSS